MDINDTRTDTCTEERKIFTQALENLVMEPLFLLIILNSLKKNHIPSLLSLNFSLYKMRAEMHRNSKSMRTIYSIQVIVKRPLRSEMNLKEIIIRNHIFVADTYFSYVLSMLKDVLNL